MSKNMIVRAWKDPKYRAGLPPTQLAEIGPHPSGEGLGELNEAELRGVVGGVALAQTQSQGCGAVCTATAECNAGTLVVPCC